VPKVSVIIPTYNRAHLLKIAVASVLSQYFVDLEVLIVDDGSEDGTADVCAGFAARDMRVRYIVQQNKGPNAARNAGIRIARGEFIAFLDSDDYWAPIKLLEQLELFGDNGSLGAVYCDWASVDESGNITPGINRTTFTLPSMQEALLYDNVVHGSASAVLIRRECFTRVGLFDEALWGNEDWDMWLRLAQHYQFAKVPQVLVYLLQHEDQSQHNKERIADGLMQLTNKMNVIVNPQYRRHLGRAQWYNRLRAAEQYTVVSRRKGWRALYLAIASHPLGIFSSHTLYVFSLCLGGRWHKYGAAVARLGREGKAFVSRRHLVAITRNEADPRP